MKNKELTILMPAFNEEKGINHALEVISSIMKNSKISYEFLIVDDGSYDSTWEVLKSCSKKYPLKAFRLSRNFGKEAALRAGIEQIVTDLAVILDSDLQHPPVIIPKMMELMKKTNADIIDGIRDYRGKESFFNKLVAKIFYRIFSSLTKIDLKKASDFKLMNRKAMNAYLKLEEKALFFRGMSAWIGFKREEFHFQTDDRISGTTKWSKKALFILSKNAIVSFSSTLLHFPLFCGFLFIILSAIITAESVYNKIIGNSAQGIPTLLAMLSFTGGLILVALSIIGEYLAKIYDEVKKRPTYLISENIIYKKSGKR